MISITYRGGGVITYMGKGVTVEYGKTPSYMIDSKQGGVNFCEKDDSCTGLALQWMN